MVVYNVVRVLVLIFSPVIVLCNIVILLVFGRYKRLRSPSNLLIAALATSDLGLGLLIPPTVGYRDLEPVQYNTTNTTLSVCDTPLPCVHLLTVLGLSSMSLLTIAAIALDRYLSVSEPLRYNHVVTVAHVQRFLIVSWLYISLVYVTPLYFLLDTSSQTLLVYNGALVFTPSLLLVCGSYLYIYAVARSHAKQIISVEISLHEVGSVSQTVVTHNTGTTQHRYGLTLGLLVVGLILWVPIHVLAAIDVWSGSTMLSQRHFLAVAVMPVALSLMMNPCLYAYHSSEIRNAVMKVLDSVIVKVTGKSRWYQVAQNKNGELSYGSNVRLLAISPTPTTGTAPGSTHGAELNGNTFPSTKTSPVNRLVEGDNRHLQVSSIEYQVSSL